MKHDHDPIRFRCRRCGTSSDEFGSYPTLECTPPQEAA